MIQGVAQTARLIAADEFHLPQSIGKLTANRTQVVYLPLIRYTFFILEFSAIFHEKTPNRAFDDGDTHDWTDKYCGYNTLILHVIFYITQKTYTKLFS